MNAILNREKMIQNAITGEHYVVRPLYQVEVSQMNLDRIIKICNEDLVYQWCFKDLCKGEKYPRELAVDWLTWGAEGWQNDTHYVYAIMDLSGNIVAACDIKSSNQERAEIGYWSSQ